MRFSLGLLCGALIPAVALYLAGGGNIRIALAFGFILPIAIALKWPKRIAAALLWISGERKGNVVAVARAGRVTMLDEIAQGYGIKSYAKARPADRAVIDALARKMGVAA